MLGRVRVNPFCESANSVLFEEVIQKTDGRYLKPFCSPGAAKINFLLVDPMLFQVAFKGTFHLIRKT
nr:hypothetical protein [Acidovorax carolinensis]